jgi:hypothetical protein
MHGLVAAPLSAPKRKAGYTLHKAIEWAVRSIAAVFEEDNMVAFESYEKATCQVTVTSF